MLMKGFKDPSSHPSDELPGFFSQFIDIRYITDSCIGLAKWCALTYSSANVFVSFEQ
jgi:hypothetical protein